MAKLFKCACACYGDSPAKTFAEKPIIKQQGQHLSVLVQNQQNQQAAMLSILHRLTEK